MLTIHIGLFFCFVTRVIEDRAILGQETVIKRRLLLIFYVWGCFQYIFCSCCNISFIHFSIAYLLPRSVAVLTYLWAVLRLFLYHSGIFQALKTLYWPWFRLCFCSMSDACWMGSYVFRFMFLSSIVDAQSSVVLTLDYSSK